MQRTLRCKDAMRTTKKLDPFQRLEHIQAAGELQWDINQDKIVEAGAKPLPAASQSPEVKEQADDRVARSLAYLNVADGMDPMMTYGFDDELARRGRLRANLRALHW